ncbi:hypothetical protein CDAR_619161 [Caerostris darwini]|uniref:Uncharacterized protein n=2 Tax=Caerostris TaxID=172845 RepID=A0AAV4U2R5_9ARAC|nr:hypothetical protein CEXT_609801 [Caerostris extrusa]GIY52022.1 hypothetical protein CDAR_619161 [Caerostris darwini]
METKCPVRITYSFLQAANALEMEVVIYEAWGRKHLCTLMYSKKRVKRRVPSSSSLHESPARSLTECCLMRWNIKSFEIAINFYDSTKSSLFQSLSGYRFL